MKERKRRSSSSSYSQLLGKALVETQKSKQHAFDGGNPSEAKDEPELGSPETNRSQVAIADGDSGEMIVSSPRI